MTTRVKWLSHSALIAAVATLVAYPAPAQTSIADPTDRARSEPVAVVDDSASETPQPSQRTIIATDENYSESSAFLQPADVVSPVGNADSLAEGPAVAQPETPIAQASTAAISDVQITVTPAGLNVELISDQPLSAGPSQIVGNALVTEIPNATLALTDATAAEQFAPTEGIALVQVSSLPEGGVQVAITGTDAPPEVQVSTVANNLVLGVTPGVALAAAESDAIQVVVTATRTEENVQDVPRSVTVIDREQIDQALLTNTTLGDILGRLVPGISPPTGEDSTLGLRLRGRPFVVLIDGIPQTPNNNGFQRDLSVIDPRQIERIEVLRGPSAIYGDGGTGGVVNIITRRPTEATFAYNVSAGFDTSLTSREGDDFGYEVEIGVSASDEQADGLLSLSYESVSSQFDAGGNRLAPNSIADSNRLGLLAKLGYNFDEQQRLAFTYSYFNLGRETNFITDPTTAPGAVFGQPLRVDATYERPPGQTNSVVSLAYSHADILNSQLALQLYYRDTELVDIFTDLGAGFPLATFPRVWQTSLNDKEWGGRLQLDTDLGESASLLWGVDYTRNETASPLLVNNDDASATGVASVVDTSLDRFPAYTLDSLGIFAQATWDITEQFQISGGLRYENVDLSAQDYQLAFVFALPRERLGGDASFDDVSFNIGLLYRPIPEVGLFTSFAQGFSIPNIGAALAAGGGTVAGASNLSPEPQKVDNYEVGIRVDLDQVQGTLTGFYNESDLGSAITIDANGFGVVERAPQRNYGFEATLDWQPTDSWRLGALYSWNDGENDVNNDGEFERLSHLEIQPQKFGFYVENDTTPGWTNRLDLSLVSVRNDVNSFVTSVGGYTIVDFSSSLQLGVGELTLGIGNLFNTQYITPRQENRGGVVQVVQNQGRTLSLRYSIDF